ncbi:OmpA family protein [Metapseudomonas resinovorans]|uniref:Putative outer membrane protein n=1 Tax=Metapseudomonas resinovorans NBRC 106553 TaxID=1245471 RepID=S6BJZ0_METRE|nr:OmpA family protein [Pseudomonas resinovorans]BAN49504.1 putative outer membrane protein [Pseudomonas resinovorans NBRC 106553]
MSAGLLLGLGLLGGCANQQSTEESLEQSRQMFQQVKEDQNVLSAAPKDVIRAGESLARAERLSSYWGNDADVVHYAYLSRRYSEIATQHSEQSQNQARAAKLQLERERLQLALREAKLLSVQQQGKWLEEQMIALAATETDRGLVMTLGDVLFDTGHADLKPSANRTVLKLVQFLQLNPRRIVRIEGYTDSSGTKADNLRLSTERAQAVADALIDLGIDAKRIQVQGFGEAFPVAENASNRGRAQNRRVEIVFSNEKGQLGQAR